MVLSRTPIRSMLPRSETLLSPPPLKRARVEENRELLLEASVTQIPASLFLPGNLDDIFPMPDLLQEDSPRICLTPRTSLSAPANVLPDVLPVLKRRASSDVLVQLSEVKSSLGFNSDAPRRRMKRRRSSMSSCGADSSFHRQVTPMAAMI